VNERRWAIPIARRAISLVLLLGMVAASPCSRTPQLKGEVIVFVGAPLSGWQADGGQTVVGGVRLMAEQLNASGGLLGKKVTVVALDDEADSDVATQVAEQVKAAVEQGQQVVPVIGH
jgi:branched-chain amino acid transport system substrate-binding protein